MDEPITPISQIKVAKPPILPVKSAPEPSSGSSPEGSPTRKRPSEEARSKARKRRRLRTKPVYSDESLSSDSSVSRSISRQISPMTSPMCEEGEKIESIHAEKLLELERKVELLEALLQRKKRIEKSPPEEKENQVSREPLLNEAKIMIISSLVSCLYGVISSIKS